MRKLKIGAKLFKAEIGHNGFFYPNYNQVLYSVEDNDNLDASVMSYVTGDSTVAAVYVKLPALESESLFFVKKEDLSL